MVLAKFIYAVAIDIIFAVNDARRASCDPLAVVIDPHGIGRIAVRARRADIDLVIVQISPTSADIRRIGSYGYFCVSPLNLV